MRPKGEGGWQRAAWLGAGSLGLLVLGAVMVWTIRPGGTTVQERATLQGHRQEVRSLAFSPDGKTLASGSYDGIKLWDVQTGQERVTLEGDAGDFVAFSPDGKMLASGGGTTIKLWDVQAGQERAAFQGHPNGGVTCVAFSPDGKTVASGSSDHTIKLWDVATGKERATLHGPPGDLYWEVLCLAFSPDGKTLASGNSTIGPAARVTLWDVATGKELATLEGHRGLDTCVAYSPDGKTLASAGRDKTIKLWGIATGK